MKIRLLSDIHLEVAKNTTKLISELIPKTKPDDISDNVLVLAGDIGNPKSDIYKDFLRQISPYYGKIFVVTGNHEYYNNDRVDPISDMDSYLQYLASKFDNVEFLQRKSYTYNNVRFLGCTLWTYSDEKLAHYMNDYKHIQGFTPNKCNMLHHSNVQWLEEQLNRKCKYKKTVVITHHMPTRQLISEKHKGSPFNVFYASDLDELVKQADMWLCGHSHDTLHVNIGKCKCYINSVGYEGEIDNYQTMDDITI